MTTTGASKLNALYTQLPAGTPITSQDLAGLGISADLAVHYVRAGWLKRLMRGVFCRPNDSLALHPSLGVLQRRLEGLHVGGKSALDWYGMRQYVAQQPVLQLYGWAAGRLPEWFTERFPAEYHRKRLFDEQPSALLHAGPFEKRSGAPQVSAPERALLELLSEVGVRQPLQEARELVESAYSLRADKVARYEEILDEYGSLADCPASWRIDVVSLSLETRHGVWVAQVPVRPKGISKKKRTIGAPEFRHYTEVQGRFTDLLPVKEGEGAAGGTLH